MYVGLFGHSAVVFRVFLCFSHVFYVLLTVCVVVFISDILLSIHCIAASLFNKLTYLLTYTHAENSRIQFSSSAVN